MSKFWTFNQNNSGGSFDFDEKAGITHIVIVEAENKEDATIRAESIGLYWDGCADGRDCECCGDRWSPPWSEDDGKPEPMYYDQPVANATGFITWMEPGKEIAVHYQNGDIKWFGVQTKK